VTAAAGPAAPLSSTATTLPAATTPTTPTTAATAQLDHIVIAAATLEEGAAWCAATLGVVPGPGGRHALFGTHNRLLRIDGERYPRTYLEIIAVDPDAPPPARRRWFGLDEPGVHERLRDEGPQLWHVVARTPSLERHLAALGTAGIDAGVALAASRPTATGLLQWRIAVRGDGALLHGGALPTLIEWGTEHPTAAMPASALQLRALALAGLPDPAVAALALDGVRFVAKSEPDRERAGWALQATFDTPRGPVTLQAPKARDPG
jgi:hypothetical protein